MAINGSSRIIEEFEARNGIVYAVSNQIIEDIFSMLPYAVTVIGVDVSIMIEALEKSGVSNMIDHCNYFNFGWIKTKKFNNIYLLFQLTKDRSLSLFRAMKPSEPCPMVL